jgi:hypothetical protein
MKLGFVIPSVGPAPNSGADLSAFCRALEDLGYDTLWVADRLLTPVNMRATYPGKEQPYPPQMTRKRRRQPMELPCLAGERQLAKRVRNSLCGIRGGRIRIACE